MVNIKGLSKAKVLKALYDGSHYQGISLLGAVKTFTLEDAHTTITVCASNGDLYFDYLHGKVLKVDLHGDEFNERLYYRDCGDGAAQRAIDSIK